MANKLTYMLIVTDNENLRSRRPITTDRCRIEYIGLNTQTIGKHFRGHRYNVIVNETKHCRLSEIDEFTTKWYYEELIGNAYADVEILDGDNG